MPIARLTCFVPLPLLFDKYQNQEMRNTILIGIIIFFVGGSSHDFLIVSCFPSSPLSSLSLSSSLTHERYLRGVCFPYITRDDFCPSTRPPPQTTLCLHPLVRDNHADVTTKSLLLIRRRLISKKDEISSDEESSSSKEDSNTSIPSKQDGGNDPMLRSTSSTSTSTTSTTTAALTSPTKSSSWTEQILSSYLGPRLLLGVLAAIYATNFPLGALLNDNLPASAATSARMLIAAIALSPFLIRLKPALGIQAIGIGCFQALGYVSQSLALIDLDPAKVSFLGQVTVLWCPLLEWIIDKKPSSPQEAPHIWIAALLCLSGVGLLELYNPPSPDVNENIANSMMMMITTASGTIINEPQSSIIFSWGDILALLQAIGFGTQVFWASRILGDEPTQVLPVTAALLATTAFLSMIWCGYDGWIGQDGWERLTLPGIFTDPTMRSVAIAILWTGLISTSLNFFLELTALGRVPPSEASVILAAEPLWAALFGALFYNTGTFTNADYAGGALIFAACIVNSVLDPERATNRNEQ